MWGSGVPGREEQGLAQGTGPGHEGKRLSKWVSPQPSVWVLKNRPPHSQLMSPHPDDLIPSRPVGRRGQGREVGVRSSPAGWGGTGKDTRPKGSGAGGTMGGRGGAQGTSSSEAPEGWAKGGRTDAKHLPPRVPAPPHSHGQAPGDAAGHRAQPSRARLLGLLGEEDRPGRRPPATHREAERRDKAVPRSEAPPL